MVDRVAKAMQCDAPDMPFSWENAARAAIEAMRDAPKNVLWAGALYADSDKDLEIWNRMLDEALR